MDRETVDRRAGGENCGDANDFGTVVVQSFSRVGYRLSGGGGRKDQKNVFVVEHHIHVFTEDHLPVNTVLGGYNVESLMRVLGDIAGAREFICKICSYNFHSLKTADRVDGSAAAEEFAHCGRDRLRFSLSAHDCCHIHKIIRVRVRGDKVPGNYTENYIPEMLGFELIVF